MSKIVPRDDFGTHEVLDRACLISEIIETYLLERGDLLKDELALATKAFEAMFDLYQLVGGRRCLTTHKGQTE